VTAVVPHLAGLSCFTANLHAYLGDEAPGAIERSVRLAVTAGPDDLLAFSHHDPPLHRLPDGTELAYQVASRGEFGAAVLDEVARYGRVLAVADAAHLPWSVTPRRTPHWVLIDGVGRAGRWHVVDRFTALSDHGRQEPFDGWIEPAAVAEAVSFAARPWDATHRRRLELAFGTRRPLPTSRGALWLRRSAPPAESLRTRRDGRRWLVGGDALAELATRFVERPLAAAIILDDVWAAAGHHAFAYADRAQRAGVDRAAALDATGDAGRTCRGSRTSSLSRPGAAGRDRDFDGDHGYRLRHPPHDRHRYRGRPEPGDAEGTPCGNHGRSW